VGESCRGDQQDEAIDRGNAVTQEKNTDIGRITMLYPYHPGRETFEIYAQALDHFRKMKTSRIGLVNLRKDIEDKAKSDNHFFVFEEKQKESAYVQRVASGELTRILTSKINNSARVEQLKFKLMNRFKYLYRFYRFIKKSFNLE